MNGTIHNHVQRFQGTTPANVNILSHCKLTSSDMKRRLDEKVCAEAIDATLLALIAEDGANARHDGLAVMTAMNRWKIFM